jgi:hypothetical protein
MREEEMKQEEIKDTQTNINSHREREREKNNGRDDDEMGKGREKFAVCVCVLIKKFIIHPDDGFIKVSSSSYERFTVRVRLGVVCVCDWFLSIYFF